jgi:hypothetical protein
MTGRLASPASETSGQLRKQLAPLSSGAQVGHARHDTRLSAFAIAAVSSRNRALSVSHVPALRQGPDAAVASTAIVRAVNIAQLPWPVGPSSRSDRPDSRLVDDEWTCEPDRP